jgi:hypothetical protein
LEEGSAISDGLAKSKDSVLFFLSPSLCWRRTGTLKCTTLELYVAIAFSSYCSNSQLIILLSIIIKQKQDIVVLRMIRVFVSLLLFATAMMGHGFVVPKSSSVGTFFVVPLVADRSRLCYTKRSEPPYDEISAEELRNDIAELRQEAIQRIAALNEKLRVRVEPPSPPELAPHKPTQNTDADLLDLMALEQEALERHNTADLHVPSPSSSSAKLMDDTRWRCMLNVGREPGTWMPPTWGVSGERLYLNLELEFSPEQLLYEREDFLNGIAGTKVLKVVHNEASLAPTMTKGGRKVKVKNGGWRVGPGEGPLGTAVLRFYLELEEQTYHHGSDVYCPAGRIYCTCGYFPRMEHGHHHDGSSSSSSLKDVLKQEQVAMVAQYEALAAENERDDSLVSWGKLQRGKQMMDLRMKANKLARKIYEAAIREPERSLLRLSQDQSVGLTREGGVCCKVQKGLAIEYHILGKFEIASMKNREHKDYRELLP